MAKLHKPSAFQMSISDSLLPHVSEMHLDAHDQFISFLSKTTSPSKNLQQMPVFTGLYDPPLWVFSVSGLGFSCERKRDSQRFWGNPHSDDLNVSWSLSPFMAERTCLDNLIWSGADSCSGANWQLTSSSLLGWDSLVWSNEIWWTENWNFTAKMS